LEFFTQPESMGEKTYNRVFCKISNRKPERLSIAAEYGEQDWGALSMALREFVSNAIDAAGGSVKGVKVDVVDETQLTPRRDKTIVAIPLTPEVQRWYQALPVMFLQFRPDAKKLLNQRVMEKVEPNTCAVYRKGVMVRLIDHETNGPSLFNYNFGDDLHIDEARNLSDNNVKENIAREVARSKTALVEIFRELSSGKEFLEANLPEFELKWTAGNNKEAWQEAWKEVYGNGVISHGVTPLTEMAQRKGHKVICIHNVAWYNAMVRAGIKSIIDCLDNVNENGHVIKDPSYLELEVMKQVWDWMDACDCLNGKTALPDLKLFEAPMEAESSKMGYYRNNTIYIHLESKQNHQTYLEELAHYVTGPGDYSRDFQDYAFRIATKLGLLLDS